MLPTNPLPVPELWLSSAMCGVVRCGRLGVADVVVDETAPVGELAVDCPGVKAGAVQVLQIVVRYLDNAAGLDDDWSADVGLEIVVDDKAAAQRAAEPDARHLGRVDAAAAGDVLAVVAGVARREGAVAAVDK